MDKNKVIVRIHGKDYTIISNEPEEYIQKVAFYVDKKMTEITKSNAKLDTTMAAVLTAVNISHDSLTNLKKVQRLESELEKSKIAYKDKNKTEAKYLETIENLKKEIQDLKDEIASKEADLENFISTFNE